MTVAPVDGLDRPESRVQFLEGKSGALMSWRRMVACRVLEYMSHGEMTVRDRDELVAALSRSRFRSRFVLGECERAQVDRQGIDVMRQHARDLVTRRLGPARPVNDGRQTPMRGHPVFIAQHATATCCRKCLAKWHRIPAGRDLDEREIEHVVEVIVDWLMRQPESDRPVGQADVTLFDGA